MEGQQVYVTGADGQGMILSGPEAAALLAQAGITLGDQDQVIIGGDAILEQLQMQAAGGDEGGQELCFMPADGSLLTDDGLPEGSVTLPEGAQVRSDGSVIAADGTLLAPAGSVVTEDGTPFGEEAAGMITEADGINSTEDHGAQEMSQGVQEVTQGVQEMSQGVQEMSQGVQEMSQSVQEMPQNVQVSQAVHEMSQNVHEMGQNVQVSQAVHEMSQNVQVSQAVHHMSQNVQVSQAVHDMSQNVQVSQAVQEMSQSGHEMVQAGHEVPQGMDASQVKAIVSQGVEEVGQAMQDSQGQVVSQGVDEGGTGLGFHIPEDSGEVLYLDPSDPAAQLLLQEAGITLGEGGVLQTADGQILHTEEGTPISTHSISQSYATQPEAASYVNSTVTSSTANLVADAAAAAGLVPSHDELGFQLPTPAAGAILPPEVPVSDTTAIDLPVSVSANNTEIRPDLPDGDHGMEESIAEQEPPTRQVFQPRQQQQVTQQQLLHQPHQYVQQHQPQPQHQHQQIQPRQPQQQPLPKYKTLTFNSGLQSGYSPAPTTSTPVQQPQRKTQMQVKSQTRKTGVPSVDMNIGPDQQKVTYTVTSENGYSQTYVMICSKSLDQNTLINTLIKNISNDPNHKGKKTIKITQHKYGAKTVPKKPQPPTPTSQSMLPGMAHHTQPRQNLVPQQTVRQSVNYPAKRGRPLASPAPTAAQPTYRTIVRPPSPQKVMAKPPSPPKPPQQILQTEPDMADLITADNLGDQLSLDDIVEQMAGGEAGTEEPRVTVRCNYCTNFRSVLNSQTWENILNHILPVAKEELHTSFYGNILKHFARGLKVQVSGRKPNGVEQCEVVLQHGLVCRRTGTWYMVDRPGIDLATQLASHVAAVQPGAAGPYGARPRGNSLICLFCLAPYTPEDYQRHLKPHQDFIIPCLLLAAGAYCATSFELEVRQTRVCSVCREGETQDLRFLPCTKFAADFNCGKRLQSTVDCFRDNFDSRGFLQVANSAMTKCSVCRTPQQTYCALFKPHLSSNILGSMDLNSHETLSVCANCQKQFVNVVMRENSFEKQLKMFQLHHMEQLCGMLRVLLNAASPVCSGQFNLLYTVQEGGSLYSGNNTVHSVVPAVIHQTNKGARLEEDNNVDMSIGTQLRYTCDLCKFSVDLTRLHHTQGSQAGHLTDMAIGVVLEHIVPHTESLLAVIMASAYNEAFTLKFEFTAKVEGEGANRRINIILDKKIVPVGGGTEVTIQKEEGKTAEVLRNRLKQDRKGYINIKKRHMLLDTPVPTDNEVGQLIEINKFLEQVSSAFSLYSSTGCNSKLLDYYSECRLCSKFSFPDFRLTASIRTQNGVSLCENCCETIVNLCVPSEPEKLPGTGELCLLLGVQRSTGHRLVLSNNSKKWISADAVEKIQMVNEAAAQATIPDYGAVLVQLLRSHLQAVAERSWSDLDCVSASAGFLVTDPANPELVERLKQSSGFTAEHQAQAQTEVGNPPTDPPPIEVKVTVRPPKLPTPPPKLVITPVNDSNDMVKPNINSGSKLVKITANRRIIPVRDPTSIKSPPRLPKAMLNNKKMLSKESVMSPLQKVTALREALAQDMSKIVNNEPAAPKAAADLAKEESTSVSERGEKSKLTNPTTEPSKALEDMSTSIPTIDASDNNEMSLLGEDEFESIDMIADFINNSEPPQKTVDPSSATLHSANTTVQEILPSHHEMCRVEDEFSTDSDHLPKSSTDFDVKNLNPSSSMAQLRLPSGTIVTNLASPEKGVQNLRDLKLPPDENESESDDAPVKIPAGLKISVATAGMVKIQAGALKMGDESREKASKKLIELGKANKPLEAKPTSNAKVIELGKKTTELKNKITAKKEEDSSPKPASSSKVIELGQKRPEESKSSKESKPFNSPKVIELGKAKESLPSPASDATTSKKETVTPGGTTCTVSSSKGVRQPIMPRLLPRQENAIDSGKTVTLVAKHDLDKKGSSSSSSKNPALGGKLSTSAKPPTTGKSPVTSKTKSTTDNVVPVTSKPPPKQTSQVPKKRGRPPKNNDIGLGETDITDAIFSGLDLELDVDDIVDEIEDEFSSTKRAQVKLSQILPKPSPKSKASSSKKGGTPAKQSAKSSSKPKPVPAKRKREEEELNKNTKKPKNSQSYVGPETATSSSEDLMDWKPEMILEKCSPTKDTTEETKKEIDKRFLLPFEFGWTREIQFRPDNSGTCDIYYVPPREDSEGGQGKKKERGEDKRKRRSIVDQEKYFQDFPSKDLSAKNFTYTRSILGFVQEGYEIIRGLPKRCDVKLVNVKLKTDLANTVDRKKAENLKVSKKKEVEKVLKKDIKGTNNPKDSPKNGPVKKITTTKESSENELPKIIKKKSGSETPKTKTKESEPAEPSFVTGTSRTGRVRKEKKIFDL